MLNHRRSYISLSTFMCVGGVAGGGALTYKLGGYHSAVLFLQFGALILLVLLMLQIIFSIKGQKRVFHLVLFNITFVFGIVYFLLCLVLPIFFVAVFSFRVKLLLLIFSSILWAANVNKGIAEFDSRWAVVGPRLLSRYYSRKEGQLDWSGVVGSLKMSVAIYIPGIPKILNPIISVLIVISMLVGLSLRNVFPVFSMFSWSIPVIIVISLIMQMIGFGVAQLSKLGAFEKEEGVVIRPK